MKLAVVGHVEAVTFLRIDRAPRPGAIALASERWDEPAGGGGVAAVELARLAGACTLYTGLGDDVVGRRIPAELARFGVTVAAGERREPHRTAITLLDPAGERTIVVVGPAQEARGAEIGDLSGVDAVYFCKGDAAAVRAARRARVLVATARALDVLREAQVPLDALVHSADDEGERYEPGDLDPEPRLVATTEGARGGRYRTADGREGRWAASPLPGPIADAYGCGDSFAAGLTYALADGKPVDEALAFAATRAAAALCRVGAHGR